MKTFFRFAGPASGIAFAVLSYWAYRHPAPMDPLGLPRPSPAFLAAALTGVFFVLWVLVRFLGRFLARAARVVGRLVWRVAGPTVGIAFAGLTYWTVRLPVLRGSMWTLKDTLVRASAVATGILFVLWVLARLLPILLDWLEGRTFESFVAARHVRSQKSGFLTVISVLSIFGVAVSACALSSVVSVMGGFSARPDAARSSATTPTSSSTRSSQVGVGAGPGEVAAERVRATRGVVAATPVVIGEVMVSSASNLAGVIVHGIDPGSIGNVIDLREEHRGRQVRVPRVDPRSCCTLPADEVIGIGPGGEQYLKGADLPILAWTTRATSSRPDGARGAEGAAAPPGPHHRPRARQDAARLRRRRGDAGLAARRPRARWA